MFLLNLLIILGVAAFGRILSRKLNQSIILGELLFGMILGTLGIAEVTPLISHFADVGVLLLLFSAGFSISMEEFKRQGTSSIIVALLGVILPFVLGFYVTRFFEFSFLPALFVGAALTATSVGINASILGEFNMFKSKIGTLIIGSAVIDDVIGVLILTILGGIAAAGGIVLENLLLTVVGIVLFFLISLTLGIKLVKKLSSRISLRRNDLMLFGLIIIFLFALAAEKIGLEIIIGAFVAGLILAQSHFSRDILEQAISFGEAFFVPIFFVTMGMGFDFQAFGSVGLFAAVLTGVALIGKILGCGLGAKLSKFGTMGSATVGIAMVPRAEVTLIINKIATENNIIGPDIGSSIVVMVIICTLITPPLLKKVIRSYEEKKG